MYPNVKTEEGLTFLIAALNAHVFKVRLIWPRKQILLAIKLLLKCNTFHFDYACFRQKGSGAMRNPFTCIWAVVHFDSFESLILESKFKNNMLNYPEAL